MEFAIGVTGVLSVRALRLSTLQRAAAFVSARIVSNFSLLFIGLACLTGLQIQSVSQQLIEEKNNLTQQVLKEILIQATFRYLDPDAW